MLTEDAVAAYLAEQGISTPWYPGGTPWSEIQDPEALILTLDGGSASQFERTFDTPSLQVLTRGDQDDHAGARELAWRVDTALYSPGGPLTFGVRVISLTRIGGPPHLLQRDDARRFIFTCNYIFTAARSTT